MENQKPQGKNLVQFGTYSTEVAEEEARHLGSTDFLKLEVGKTRVRVLPPTPGEKSPFKIVQQHAITRLGEKYPYRFACIGPDCPACAEAHRLDHTGNPRDRELGKSYEKRLKVFTLAINRAEEGRGPLVWEFGKTIYTKFNKLRCNEDAGGEFCHPYDGYDVLVDRVGTGLDTRYELLPARLPSALCADEQVMADWCNNRPSLEKFTRIMTLEEVQRELEAVSGGDDSRASSPPRRQIERGASEPKRRTIEDDFA